MKPEQFPPYGRLHRDHLDECGAPRVPTLWKSVGPPSTYLAFIDGVLADIREGLWPAWNEEAGAWNGATQSMDALTDHDLRLMGPLARVMDSPVSPLPGVLTHRQMFLLEDGIGGSPGSGLASYEPSLSPAATHYDPAQMFSTGLISICGSAAILLKKSLQRPRAYQMSYLKQVSPAVRYHANTSDTPSMISGHCLEGSLGGAWTAWRHKEWVAGLDWRVAEPALRQWTVDIGDRRVMAQVHYPSDNIGSWWVALRILHELEHAGAEGAIWMRSFLRNAIQASRVFKALKGDPPPGVPLWAKLVELVESQAGS